MPIGKENISKEILSSNLLEASDIDLLAKWEEFPNETDVNEYKLIELSEIFMDFEDNPTQLENELHLLAKKHLSEGNIEEAWMTLLTFNNH